MAAHRLRRHWYRHTYRTRGERLWLGMVLIGTLAGTAGLIGADLVPGPPEFPQAFWHRPPTPPGLPLVMVGLYVSGALALLADLSPCRWLPATLWLWHWAIGLSLFTGLWCTAVGFPGGALAYGWPALVALASVWLEPADPELGSG